MDTLNIAIIGECMVELQRQDNDIRQGFGGDTLNTAVYLARQLPRRQGKVHYVSALGTDNFSQTMLDNWQQEGLNTTLVQRLANKMPGLYFIDTDSHGERSFSYWRSDNPVRASVDCAGLRRSCGRYGRASRRRQPRSSPFEGFCCDRTIVRPAQRRIKMSGTRISARLIPPWTPISR